jgi:5-(carboxyamino)imidazole ribonucleotide synthase
MNNLLGEDMGSLPEILITSGIHVHLYGKKEAKLGRKMGHTNRLLNI